MFINAYDMARFGYLTLRRGKWGDRQLLSETWVNMALTPTGVQSPYGFINYFLNTDRKQWPSAGTAFMHNGNGLSMIYVDPENDLVAVVRWIDNNAVDGFLKRLIAAVAAKSWAISSIHPGATALAAAASGPKSSGPERVADTDVALLLQRNFDRPGGPQRKRRNGQGRVRRTRCRKQRCRRTTDWDGRGFGPPRSPPMSWRPFPILVVPMMWPAPSA